MARRAMEDLPPDFDLVRVRGLTLPFMIGVFEFEKHAAQTVVIDVDMAVDRAVRARGEYVTYADVVEFAIALSETREHIELVETLAEKVLAKALSDSRVARARVTVMKTEIYSQAEGVGVTIEGLQDEAAA